MVKFKEVIGKYKILAVCVLLLFTSYNEVISIRLDQQNYLKLPIINGKCLLSKNGVVNAYEIVEPLLTSNVITISDGGGIYEDKGKIITYLYSGDIFTLYEYKNNNCSFLISKRIVEKFDGWAYRHDINTFAYFDNSKLVIIQNEQNQSHEFSDLKINDILLVDHNLAFIVFEDGSIYKYDYLNKIIIEKKQFGFPNNHIDIKIEQVFFLNNYGDMIIDAYNILPRYYKFSKNETVVSYITSPIYYIDRERSLIVGKGSIDRINIFNFNGDLVYSLYYDLINETLKTLSNIEKEDLKWTGASLYKNLILIYNTQYIIYWDLVSNKIIGGIKNYEEQDALFLLIYANDKKSEWVNVSDERIKNKLAKKVVDFDFLNKTHPIKNNNDLRPSPLVTFYDLQLQGYYMENYDLYEYCVNSVQGSILSNGLIAARPQRSQTIKEGYIMLKFHLYFIVVGTFQRVMLLCRSIKLAKSLLLIIKGIVFFLHTKTQRASRRD